LGQLPSIPILVDVTLLEVRTIRGEIKSEVDAWFRAACGNRFKYAHHRRKREWLTRKLITGADKFSAVAVLYGVDGRGRTVELGRHRDSYALLGNDYSEQAKRHRLFGIALLATGWAAPLTQDGESECPPSIHPDGVRVALVVTMTIFGHCVAIDRADEPEIYFEEAPEPSGPLQSAMVNCMLNMLQKAVA
jgi:hypothetical protein